MMSKGFLVQFLYKLLFFCRRHQTMIHIGSASFLAKRYEENMFCSIFMQQFFKKKSNFGICLLDFGKFKEFLASFPEYWMCTYNCTAYTSVLAALLDCLATHQCYLHSFLIFLIIIHSLISNCIAHVAHKYYILKLKV